MKEKLNQNIFCSIFFLISTGVLIVSNNLYATENQNKIKTNGSIYAPMVTSQILKKAEENNNWKTAFATGKHAQVVFMNVSPETNPKNEIGLETHPFDQVIIVVAGKGKAVINDKEFPVSKGDMIFIPEGTPHNVINLEKEKSFKIISFYSSTDIPANSSFKNMSDATE